MRLDTQLLRGLPFLDALPPAERDALALCFQGRGYAPGEIVFEEGDPGATMLLVAQGTLAAVSTSSRGPSSMREVGRYSAGQIIGEAALVDPTPRVATLKAVTAALVYEIGEDSLEVLRRNAPKAARALTAIALRGVLRRLRAIEQRVEVELDRASVPW